MEISVATAANNIVSCACVRMCLPALCNYQYFLLLVSFNMLLLHIESQFPFKILKKLSSFRKFLFYMRGLNHLLSFAVANEKDVKRS